MCINSRPVSFTFSFCQTKHMPTYHPAPMLCKAVLMKLLDCGCSLNTFMAESQLPPSLRARLREFFRYRRSARSLHDCPDLLQAMSPALRAQVASHTQAKWVNTVPFFRWTQFLDELDTDTLSQGYTSLQSLGKCLDHRTQLLLWSCQHFVCKLFAEVMQQHHFVIQS